VHKPVQPAMKLSASVLMMGGQPFKVPGAVHVALGIAVIVMGLWPGMDFYAGLPTQRPSVRKRVPRWFGRLWFVAGGAILIYWGVTGW
jgi:hypothetical protein